MQNKILKQNVIFDANIDGEKISHLKFSKKFKIAIGSKNKIILGSNGIGKTTLYNFIKNNHNQYHYLDYDSLKNDLIRKGKKIEIGLKIKVISERTEEKKNIIDNNFIKSQIKSIFKINRATDAKECNEILGKKYGNEEEALTKFNSDDFATIGTIQKEQLVFVFKNKKILETLESYQYTVEQIRNILIETSLEHLEKYINSDEKQCPVCDSIKSHNIKEIIKIKLAETKKIESELARKIHLEFPEKNQTEILSFFNELKISSKTISENKISQENIFNFLITDGDQNIINSVMQQRKRLIEINEELKTLQEESDKFYSILNDKQDEIKLEFKNSFGIVSEQIVFDSVSKNIKITLNRDVNQYSTGEINLMVFTINLYEGIASEKELIVIDDPLSSYDVINQYKIIYKIADAYSNYKKKLLIFTHSIATINISNSQNDKIFEYQYIEKNTGELFVQDIESMSSGSSLRIEELLKPKSEKIEYIKKIIDKHKAPETSNLHKIFHYDEPFSEDGFSNDYLVSLVDNFTGTFENKSFKINCIDKAIFLTAIRVWIEKQFYLCNPKDDKLRACRTIGAKILYLFPRNAKSKWSGSNKITRAFLMSRKVMLNQNTHIESQPTPFEYALSLSLDVLSQEIMEIKESF